MREKVIEWVKSNAWRFYFLTVMQLRWNLSLPPWTRVLVRYALIRNQAFGDNDKRGNLAWKLAMKTTWDTVTAQKYAARCLVYGIV